MLQVWGYFATPCWWRALTHGSPVAAYFEKAAEYFHMDGEIRRAGAALVQAAPYVSSLLPRWRAEVLGAHGVFVDTALLGCLCSLDAQLGSVEEGAKLAVMACTIFDVRDAATFRVPSSRLTVQHRAGLGQGALRHEHIPGCA